MIKLSDHDANEILDRIKYYLSRLRVDGFKGKQIDEQLLVEMMSYLKNGQRGCKYNVCFHCCGTGYNDGKTK